MKVWCGDWSDACGARRRVQFGTNRGDAERALAKLVRERDLERFGLRNEGGLDLPLGELFDAYLADLEPRARPRGLISARYAIEHLRKRFPARRVRDVTKATALEYRRKRLAEGMAHATVNAELGTLKAALSFGLRADMIGANPLASLRALPVTPEHRRRTARALTEAEIPRLLAAAEELDRELGRFPRAPLIRALIVTGLRWNEARTLTWRDLDRGARMLHVRPERAKTGHGRSIPLDADTLEALRSLKAHALRVTGHLPGPGSPIFRRSDGKPLGANTSGVRKFLIEALDRASIQRVTPEGRIHVHGLRHTFATRCARAGVPIQQTQYLTGHRTLGILLAVYTHLAAEDTREALAKVPPLPSPSQAPARAESPVRKAIAKSGA